MRKSLASFIVCLFLYTCGDSTQATEPATYIPQSTALPFSYFGSEPFTLDYYPPIELSPLSVKYRVDKDTITIDEQLWFTLSYEQQNQFIVHLLWLWKNVN